MQDLAYQAVRTAHIQRNIRAVVIKHPSWMDKLLVDALSAIIERHTIRIDGLRSGFKVDIGPKSITKALAFDEIDLTIPELSNCEVSETLNAWVEGAIKAQSDAANSFAANIEAGLSVLFFELNATHTHATRVWYLEELFPKDTGLMNAYMDLQDKLRDAPLDDTGTFIRPTFVFDRVGSKYNSEAARELVKGILKNGAPSTQGYAEPMRPGDVFVFTVDEHDPDPVRTVEFIKEEVKNRGINVVILDPNVAAMLQSDEPVDFEKLKAVCIKPPAEWESPEIKVEIDLLEDLHQREIRLSTDTGLNQSLYWNYVKELSKSVAANAPNAVNWVQGAVMMKMPAEFCDLLHAKLDQIGIPTAVELRAQGWQPPQFPKQRQLDPLQHGECEVQNAARQRADNFPDVDPGEDRVASIQIPKSLQDLPTPVRRDDAPYGTGYQTQPTASQVGNDIPEGWKAPHVDIDTTSSNDDSGSTQSSD